MLAFSAVKMGGPFSLRCLSPLCSPAAGAKQTQPMQVGMLHYNLEDFAAQKTGLFFLLRLVLSIPKTLLWMHLRSLDIFYNTKCQREFLSTLAFLASHEACRRMAVFPIQLTRNPYQTGEPWHPSCHGGKTPVKPHVTLRPCAHSAQRWVHGFSPANGCFGRSAGGSCGCRSAFR